MSTSKWIILVVVIFVLGGISSYFYIVSTINSPDAMSGMTKSEYIEKAVPNCSSNGDLTAAECTCVYSKWIDAYGIEGTWALDKEAAFQNDSSLTDAEINVISGCFSGQEAI